MKSCPHCGKDIDQPPPQVSKSMVLMMIAIGPICAVIVGYLMSLYDEQVISGIRWLLHLL